jgi:hypothetical protein
MVLSRVLILRCMLYGDPGGERRKASFIPRTQIGCLMEVQYKR